MKKAMKKSGVKNKLKELREARGLSQAALGAKVGTSAAQINRLEKGLRKLTIDWILRLTEALGTTAEELVDLPLGNGVGGGKCDQALLETALGALMEAADKLKLKPSRKELSKWASYVYNEAIEQKLTFKQTRDLAANVIKISRQFGK